MKTPHAVTKEQIENQYTYIDGISELIRGKQLRAYTQTFGCQQNESDTERIRGMLVQMGYEITNDVKEADFVLYNTCAVREHAEDRALGIIGELKHLKSQKPDSIFAVCGCMAQQEKNVEKIKKSYKQIDLLFGTHALWRFPSLLYRAMTTRKRIFDIEGDGVIAEGLPVMHENSTKAWLSIMYGCNNFCTYCIVPYVRGRERSRQPEDIEKEFSALVKQGYKEITLLGQNVNSYGKDLENKTDFSDLLQRLNQIPGDFLIRFMTSHPKDASEKLFDTMKTCDKVAKQLHLPVQSGSNEILSKMNRGYTAERYQNLISYARKQMPNITVTSDIIIGFPGETEDDFLQTLHLVEQTEYDQLFTFLYSKRSGTPAADYPDETTQNEKQDRFDRLLNAQNKISDRKQAHYMGGKLRVLVDDTAKNKDYPYTARTEGNLLVCLSGEDIQIGEFVWVKIEKTSLRCLYARKV